MKKPLHVFTGDFDSHAALVRCVATGKETFEYYSSVPYACAACGKMIHVDMTIEVKDVERKK